MKRTDRDRVLMNIAIDTSGTCHDNFERIDSGWSVRLRFGHPVAQFIPLEMADVLKMPLKRGDVVRCKTNPNHHWGIAVFVEKTGYSDWLLREIGGESLLKMGNEDLDVLRFMSPSRLYTGHQHQVYVWASGKAFMERYNPDADYFKRCGGVEFEGETLVIWSRPHIWVMEKKGEEGTVLFAQPKKFVLPWDKNTRLRDIVAAMRNQGFGTDFEYLPVKPTEDQAGCATFTKDDLQKIVSHKLIEES